MKTITFKKHLIPLVQSGAKTQTRRIVKLTKNGLPIKRFRPGDVCIVKHSRFKDESFGFIKILDVSKQMIYQVTPDDAVAEGFKDRQEFLNEWAWINFTGLYLPEIDVWKIEFEYLENNSGLKE